MVYIARITIIYLGARNERNKYSHDVINTEMKPFVSIVIPARNEEHNIENAVRSVAACVYPNDRFEIIAVNDRSEDNTLNILKNLQNSVNNLKIVNVETPAIHPNLKGKSGALDHGINHAKGEIIMMTDADCTVHKGWITSIVNEFEDPHVGLVPSFTIINAESIFETVQEVEWIYMHSMASAGVGLNMPLGCFGNNLSVRKSVYNELGGYSGIKFSVTEDLALEQAVHKIGKKIRYSVKEESLVTTLPCHTFGEYMSQHRRWAKGGLGLGWLATIFVLSSFALWAALALAIISLKPLWIFFVLFVRIFGDYAIIEPTLQKLKLSKLITWIIPSVLFFMFIELIIPFTLFDRKIKWKGQVFK